jgi:hypothetical protein
MSFRSGGVRSPRVVVARTTQEARVANGLQSPPANAAFEGVEQ